MAENPVKTLIIDNFRGSMTSYPNGDINSGLSYMINVFGQNPLAQGKYGTLTWSEKGNQIDAAGDVVTDLIVDGKERVEGNIMYVYAIGHTGRLYKIQVNDPSTFNPDFDNPVLLATLTAQSPTFTRGGHLEFFGDTERIYISHDKGVTRINFDGTSETFVGVLGSWTQNVPKPMREFVGKLYVGNGANVAEIDSTATVTTYTKFSPGFPSNTQVRDMEVTVDGNYMQFVVTRLAMPSIFSASQEVASAASTSSYVFRWNGTDTGYTSFTTYPSFTLTSNIMFGNYNYVFGYDQFGMAVFNPIEKIITAVDQFAPLPNAISSSGNMMTWMTPLFYIDHLEMTYGLYGSHDYEIGGYWSPFGQLPTGVETDVVQVPWQLPVSNFGAGASSNGYAGNIFSKAKVYYSQLETSASTTAYKLYKWSPGDATGAILDEWIYQTQTQLFGKKILPTEVRIYGEPWAAGVSFKIDLIGPGDTPITGGSITYTEGTNLTAGADFAWYKPTIVPTYALGIFITTNSEVNFTINKIEIDYVSGGK